MPPRVVATRPATIVEFNALRGTATLCVLYLHSYFSPWAVTPHWELLVLRISHLFAHSAVPVFLFMSGFLLTRDRSHNIVDFARRRLHRLVLPLLVWMTVALAFEAWTRGGLSRELLTDFALFDIEGQDYYLFVLLLLTFVVYPLRWCPDAWLPSITAAAFALNLATVAYYSSMPITGLAATLAYRNPLMWVFPVIAGLWLGRTRGNVVFRPRTVAGATVGMAVLAATYLIRGETTGEYPTSYFGVTVFLFGALGLFVYPAMARGLARFEVGRIMLWPVEQLAPYAFAVYLVHKPYFLGYLSDRLVSDGRFADDYLTLMLALFVVGSVSTIVAVVTVGWVAPRFAATILGVDAGPSHHEVEHR